MKSSKGKLNHLQNSQSITYVITFQLDRSFRTRDLNPFDGVNSSPLDALKMIVLLCCPLLLSAALASCQNKFKHSHYFPTPLSTIKNNVQNEYR